MSECTEFVVIDCDDWVPCRCPSCKGFLTRDFPLGKQFQCKKCGSILETLPARPDDPDEEEDTDMEWGGRICKVPHYAVKIEVKKYPRAPRNRKHRTRKWALGEKFSRRVWKDKNGNFINVNGERIELTDSRILKIHEGLKRARKKVKEQ